MSYPLVIYHATNSINIKIIQIKLFIFSTNQRQYTYKAAIALQQLCTITIKINNLAEHLNMAVACFENILKILFFKYDRLANQRTPLLVKSMTKMVNTPCNLLITDHSSVTTILINIKTILLMIRTVSLIIITILMKREIISLNVKSVLLMITMISFLLKTFLLKNKITLFNIKMLLLKSKTVSFLVKTLLFKIRSVLINVKCVSIEK